MLLLLLALGLSFAPSQFVNPGVTSHWVGTMDSQLYKIFEPACPAEGGLRASYRVKVKMTVDIAGQVKEVRIRGVKHPAASAAILAALKRWEFKPTGEDRVLRFTLLVRFNC